MKRLTDEEWEERLDKSHARSVMISKVGAVVGIVCAFLELFAAFYFK